MSQNWWKRQRKFSFKKLRISRLENWKIAAVFGKSRLMQFELVWHVKLNGFARILNWWRNHCFAWHIFWYSDVGQIYSLDVEIKQISRVWWKLAKHVSKDYWDKKELKQLHSVLKIIEKSNFTGERSFTEILLWDFKTLRYWLRY